MDGGNTSVEVDSIGEIKAKSSVTQSALDSVSTTPRRKKSVLVDALVDLPKFQRRPEIPSHSNVDSLIDSPAFQNEDNSAPGTPEVPGKKVTLLCLKRKKLMSSLVAVPKSKKFDKKIQYILDEIVKTEVDYRNDLIKYMDVSKLPRLKK